MIALSPRLTSILVAAREARVGRELTVTEQRELAEGLAAHLELAAALGRNRERDYAVLRVVYEEAARDRDDAIENLACARDDLAAVRAHCQAPVGETAVLAAQRVRRERDEARAEVERLRTRSRDATQRLVEEIGADGPESVEDAARRAVAEIERLRALVPVEAPKAEPARWPVAVGQVRRAWSGSLLRVAEVDAASDRAFCAPVVGLGGMWWRTSTIATWPLVSEAPEVDEPVRGDGS